MDVEGEADSVTDQSNFASARVQHTTGYITLVFVAPFPTTLYGKQLVLLYFVFQILRETDLSAVKFFC